MRRVPLLVVGLLWRPEPLSAVRPLAERMAATSNHHRSQPATMRHITMLTKLPLLNGLAFDLCRFYNGLRPKSMTDLGGLEIREMCEWTACGNIRLKARNTFCFYHRTYLTKRSNIWLVIT